LSHLQREWENVKLQHEQAQQMLIAHQASMERKLFDIEILFRLKQGQVEICFDEVINDHSDMVVIEKEVVESRNRRILELGKDKVGTLEITKEFRKKLNLIDWEHKMLGLKMKDLEERTKDVHMLRVTKELQSLLKGGEESGSKADTDVLQRKLEHYKLTTQQREQSLRKQYSAISHSTKLRKMENSMLEKKLRELQQSVFQREHIERLKETPGGAITVSRDKEGLKKRIINGGGRIVENEGQIRVAQANFREVRTQQNLIDTAKKHADEICLLRKELDRLRQRTFPSFIQSSEKCPD